MTAQNYQGAELDIFSQAIYWKKYYGEFVQPFLQGNVLEVGAGIGGTTAILCRNHQVEWVCLEPDEHMAGIIRQKIFHGQLPPCCRVVSGHLADLSPEVKFHAILYIDVLEHIQHDRAELEQAGDHLRPGGSVIVVAPAHQWLFSPFDAEIGHYRRYNKKTLQAVTPDHLKIVNVWYLDSVGLLLSLSNKVLLKQTMPSQAQINFWSHVIVPISKRIDWLSHYKIGKSIVGIWKKK